MSTSVRSDRDEIEAVLLRFTSGIDRRDWELLRSAFTDDCHVEMGEFGAFDGADEITAYEAAAHADVGPSLHRMTNFDIVVEGDAARARTYVDAWISLTSTPPGPAAHAIGTYDDQLVRTPRGWRIARRVFTSVRLDLVES